MADRRQELEARLLALADEQALVWDPDRKEFDWFDKVRGRIQRELRDKE